MYQKNTGTKKYFGTIKIGGIIPSKSHIKKITKILGISPETLSKELYQFYDVRRKELKK